MIQSVFGVMLAQFAALRKPTDLEVQYPLIPRPIEWVRSSGVRARGGSWPLCSRAVKDASPEPWGQRSLAQRSGALTAR